MTTPAPPDPPPAWLAQCHVCERPGLIVLDDQPRVLHEHRTCVLPPRDAKPVGRAA